MISLKQITESKISTPEQLEEYTCGYVLEDGSLAVLDSYHGDESDDIHNNCPQFSSTHPEEDTCIRLTEEPNDEQYKTLEYIIDKFLDWESYCKIEIWKDLHHYSSYAVYSLFQGACGDVNFEEKVGNWTGYKLVKLIKDLFKNKPITEATRNSLISKSKSADKYANGKGSRWTRKSNCSVANTVKDYNKIDMNTFWKEDKLNFGIKVKGETDDYVVTIQINNVLPRIQDKIKNNKNLLEYKCIYDSLISAINSSDVLISCTCPDYKYRLKYWASKNGYEAGTKETRAANMTNPDDTKGAACKHILAVLNNVDWLRKIASVINNYSNYCKDNLQNLYARYIFPKLYGMPYQKALQMSVFDYDKDGNVIDTLNSDEKLINLSNALGKVRGRIKKGSNKNPISKK